MAEAYWQRTRREFGARLLTLAIWGVSLYGFVAAFGLNERARRMPIIMVGALLVLVTVQVVREWWPGPRLDTGDEPPGGLSAGGAGTAAARERAQEHGAQVDAAATGGDRGAAVAEWVALSSVIACFALVLLVGYRWAAPAFVFLLTWRYGRHSVLVSVLAAAATYALLVGLFGGVFGVRLYPGLLG